MRLSPVNLAKLNKTEMETYWDAGDDGHRRKYLCLKDGWIRIRFISEWDGKWIVHDSNCEDYSELQTFDEVYEIFLN